MLTRRTRIVLLTVIIGAVLFLVLGSGTDVLSFKYRFRVNPSPFLTIVGLASLSATAAAAVAFLITPADKIVPLSPSWETKLAVGIAVPIEFSGPLFLMAELRRHGVEVATLAFCADVAAEVISRVSGNPEEDLAAKAYVVQQLETEAVQIAQLHLGDWSSSKFADRSRMMKLMGAHGVHVAPPRDQPE